MSEHDDTSLPPMDGDLRTLLAKGSGTFDHEASEHAGPAFERLARSLPGLVPPGGEGSGSQGGDNVQGAASSAGSAVANAGTGALARLAVPILASLLVGGAIGAAVTHALEPTRERIVYMERPAPLAAATSPASAVSAPASAVRVEDLRPVAVTASAATTAASTAASPGAQVAEERLLLDGARSAFASGDYDKALAELRRHGARFPAGVLAEERDALTVRALAALGSTREADALARTFVAKYPESIMRPAVESAIRPHADRDGGH